MSNAGKKVMVHYVGTLDDGTVFDSSRDRGEPIAFVCMAEKMIPGFDRAVNEMASGETRDVRIEPQDAYGPHDPQLVFEFCCGQSVQFCDHKPTPMVLDSTQDGMARWVGLVDKDLVLQTPVGEAHRVAIPGKGIVKAPVYRAQDGKVSFDLNHPLAGKALNFNIKLMAVLG